MQPKSFSAEIKMAFNRNGGILRTSEILRRGIHPRVLYRMRDDGELIEMSRGVYRLAELPEQENSDLIAVGKRIEAGVFCLISALSFHRLTTEIPHEVYVAIRQGKEKPRINYPIEVELPQLLDSGNPRLLGYTPESSIAEKFQAMVALDLTNTRMKDFYDIWLLSRNLEFDETILAKAIVETFRRRETALPASIPAALTSAFTGNLEKLKQWRAFLKKSRLDETVSLETVAETIKEFLMPVVKRILD